MKPMGKRLLLIAVAAVCVVTVAAGSLSVAGRSVVSGRYLRTDNGTHILISDDGAPIVLREQPGREGMFDALETGAQVLVVCGGINESYPAQSRAFLCVRLSSGGPQDLPHTTLEQLDELGWINMPV